MLTDHDLTSTNTSSDHDVGQFQQIQDVSLVIVTGAASTGVRGRRPPVIGPGPVDVVLAAATGGHLPDVLNHWNEIISSTSDIQLINSTHVANCLFYFDPLIFS